jgi:predicted protein tyrosine phosphatase
MIRKLIRKLFYRETYTLHISFNDGQSDLEYAHPDPTHIRQVVDWYKRHYRSSIKYLKVLRNRERRIFNATVTE